MSLRRRRLVALFLCAACGTARPPKELFEARTAFARARTGKAAQYAPTDLHSAKVALTAAEAAALDDPESPEALALSYVALRTIQLAEVKANTRAADAELSRAEEAYQQLTETEMTRARGELVRAKEALMAEREARTTAEAHYRDAIRKLGDAAAVSIREETRGTVILLPGSVLFRSAESTLTPTAQQKLNLIAGTLAPQAEDHDIIVEGHTDSRGSRRKNQDLGLERARVVTDFLIARGVPGNAINAVGVGADRPIADNNTKTGRSQNRRVEIVIRPRPPAPG